MIPGIPICPQPPEWHLDWESVIAASPWLAPLADCMQDTVHHGEGDVLTHTQMVCEAMATSEPWQALDPVDRQVLYAAALLHDVAKPLTRKEEENGHIGFPGHSRRGAVMARKILWHSEAPFVLRERIVNLVRRHLVPFHLITRDDSQSMALKIAQTVRCDHLAILAEADARGRICKDLQVMLDNIELFKALCSDHQCLESPYPFATDHARFVYFQERSSVPDYIPHEDFRREVVIMSGLPGVGKDHWIAENLPDWPVISLDAIREETGISPADNQGAVLHIAKERAREHLRNGQRFVWNATCLSRQVRAESIRLMHAYHAHIRIVYLEVTPERQHEQNHQRSRPVPQKVIDRMMHRWEVPDLTEAHVVSTFVEAS